MKSLLSSLLTLSLLAPATALAKDDPAPAKPAPSNHRAYYGTPTDGVQLLRVDRRQQLLQELQQRVINLQKLRNRTGLSPEYARESRIYERVLRRVGNNGLQHYRAQYPQYRLIWQDGKLTRVPIQTPDDIEKTIDAYEYERAVRTSPDDECKYFSGARQSLCRYQQRVNARINN